MFTNKHNYCGLTYTRSSCCSFMYRYLYISVGGIRHRCEKEQYDSRFLQWVRQSNIRKTYIVIIFLSECTVTPCSATSLNQMALKTAYKATGIGHCNVDSGDVLKRLTSVQPTWCTIVNHDCTIIIQKQKKLSTLCCVLHW